MTQIEFFQVTLPFIDKKAFERVLHFHNLRREAITHKKLVEIALKNPQFLFDYARLVQDALRSRKMLKDLQNGALDFTTGKFDWNNLLPAIASLFGTTYDFYNTAKTGTSVTSAAQAAAEAKKNEEEAKKTRTTMLIVGGVILVIIITIVLLIATKK